MNKYIISALALAFGLSLSGCKKDFLDTRPTNALGEEQVQGTETGLEMLANGIHNYMYVATHSVQSDARGHQGLMTRISMMGDDVINTWAGYHMEKYRWIDGRNPEGEINEYTWDFYYTLIDHANRAIVGVDALGASNEKMKRVKATAHAMRAFSYLYLVQLFGKRYVAGSVNSQLGVPLRLVSSLSNQPRATVEEVYAQIDKDLKVALELLEPLTDTGLKNTIRYSTVCGIAARVALAKQDYVNAEKYAELTIQKSGATLQSGDALNDGFNNMGASEWIWGYTQASDQGFGYASFGASYCYNFPRGHVQGLKFAVNRSMYDAMGANDVRRKWWVCLDLGMTIPSDASAAYFLNGTSPSKRWEFTGQSIKFKLADANDTRMDQLIMRLGEMYYIAAEAEARQSKDAEALATLRAVMITRDPSYAYSGSGPNLIDEIMRNKAIDLWFEGGTRFFDMKRLSIVPNRLAAKNFDIVGTFENANRKTQALDRNRGDNAKNIPTTVDSKHWEFAIPYKEIKAFPSIAINPL